MMMPTAVTCHHHQVSIHPSKAVRDMSSEKKRASGDAAFGSPKSRGATVVKKRVAAIWHKKVIYSFELIYKDISKEKTPHSFA
ncbi:hypothetical protein CEXT_159751 [Caerostris extrusa]|uniref:Uncharacterized protein n=1 Tax=Caerostris extrusa TaxID=172846 RepID=A0AAV4TLY0_CAEEX|nr:hypothetical protein CEXT_159751 [Caerostris extrusa]